MAAPFMDWPLVESRSAWKEMALGITITADEDGTTFPRKTTLLLECDAVEEFFCRGAEAFTHPDGFIGAHRDAMKAGWLERQTSDGRIWMCPRCSGKVTG